MTVEQVVNAYTTKHALEVASQNVAKIRRAYIFALDAHKNQRRASREPYIQHPLHVAHTLASLGLDSDTIIAALLHDTVEDNKNITLELIEKEFGSQIRILVDAVTKLDTKFDQGPLQAKQKSHVSEMRIEYLRKMFIAMAKDIRVVLIKLADRFHNMQTIKYLPKEKQRRIAQETLDIYAPIADRLGIFELKWQLEDLAFEILQPREYNWIKKEMQERRAMREEYAKKIATKLAEKLQNAKIKCTVEYRVKHFYSIYKKAVTKYDRDVSRVYDLIAMRVIAPSVAKCYSALGIIHQTWKPLAHRIKDYIAIPKLNNYQALHTTVFTDDGKLTEIQIQTPSMLEESEFGVAAHWNYTEQKKESTVAKREQLSWIKQITTWHQKALDSKDFLDAVKIDVFQDIIFIFTNNGEVIDLPTGSTAIDLAFRIDPKTAPQMRRVKINDRVSPLNQILENGDVVEIVKTPECAKPMRIWIKYAKTREAKNAIADYFTAENN